MDTKVQNITTGAAYAGAGIAATLGSLSAQEWAAVTGALCAVATFFVNWYYKAQAARVDARLREVERAHIAEYHD